MYACGDTCAVDREACDDDFCDKSIFDQNLFMMQSILIYFSRKHTRDGDIIHEVDVLIQCFECFPIYRDSSSFQQYFQ